MNFKNNAVAIHSFMHRQFLWSSCPANEATLIYKCPREERWSHEKLLICYSVMWIVAWKLANWSLRTHCYKGGHPSVRRTESLKLWKKPPLSPKESWGCWYFTVLRPSYSRTVFFLAPSAWVQHRLQTWDFIHICEMLPCFSNNKGEGYQNYPQISTPREAYALSGISLLEHIIWKCNLLQPNDCTNSCSFQRFGQVKKSNCNREECKLFNSRLMLRCERVPYS